MSDSSRQALTGSRKLPAGFHLFLASSKELLHTACGGVLFSRIRIVC